MLLSHALMTHVILFLMISTQPKSTLFPYTTLFRSLLRHGSDKTLQVGYANHFYRSAHKFDWRIQPAEDRKSGSAGMPRPISYAVFCLKKKKKSVIDQIAA